MRSSRSLGVLAAALLSAAMLVATGGGASAVSWTITPVVGGLNGPRGVAFDGQGSMYVAEAGNYFNIAPGPFGVSHTGKVSKFALSGGAPSLVCRPSSIPAMTAPTAALALLAPRAG